MLLVFLGHRSREHFLLDALGSSKYSLAAKDEPTVSFLCSKRKA
jgi:hypothetical protein